MELTQAELIFATTTLHAVTIVGFDHLFPTNSDEKEALWKMARTQLEAKSILQQQEDGYHLDPMWLYQVAVAADPESALITQRSDARGTQTVGTYFGDGVAVELVQTGANQVHLRALPSVDLALTRIVTVIKSAPNTMHITSYHPTIDGLQPQPEWHPTDGISVQSLEALLP